MTATIDFAKLLQDAHVNDLIEVRVSDFDYSIKPSEDEPRYKIVADPYLMSFKTQRTIQEGLHANGYRDKDTYHLRVRDDKQEASSVMSFCTELANHLGCPAFYLQRTQYPQFDLYGVIMKGT